MRLRCSAKCKMPSMETAVIHFKARPDIRLKIQNKSMNLCEDICCRGENVEGYVHELVSVYINIRQRKTTHLGRDTFIKQIHAHKLLSKLHHCEWRSDKILYLQVTLKQSFVKKLPCFEIWTWKKKLCLYQYTPLRLIGSYTYLSSGTQVNAWSDVNSIQLKTQTYEEALLCALPALWIALGPGQFKKKKRKPSASQGLNSYQCDK